MIDIVTAVAKMKQIRNRSSVKEELYGHKKNNSHKIKDGPARLADRPCGSGCFVYDGRISMVSAVD